MDNVRIRTHWIDTVRSSHRRSKHSYTVEGQFGTGPNAMKGHDALHKLIADLHQRTVETEAKTGKKRVPMYHANKNHYLEFVDKDHAILRSYYMTMVAADGPTTPARVAAAGWERNQLVRVNGKWLIQVRDTAPSQE